VRVLTDLRPERSSLPAASLERCYQAVAGTGSRQSSQAMAGRVKAHSTVLKVTA
jgi:hypothetical protein